MITRRQAILAALAVPADAFFSNEFWNAKLPARWTEPEIRQLLNKSPWAKAASISDKSETGPLSSAPAAARRRGRGGASPPGAPPNSPALIKWHATVRWESALPVREALHRGDPGPLPEDYILNVFGEVPSGDTDSAEDALKDSTTLAHKGDQIRLKRIEPAPQNELSEPGMLFYFSRLLALRLEDKEVTFSTRLGPLEVKCQFALKDMLYRGNLEL